MSKLTQKEREKIKLEDTRRKIYDLRCTIAPVECEIRRLRHEEKLIVDALDRVSENS